MGYEDKPVNITYDALWLKSYVDSENIYVYDKDVFVAHGLFGRKDVFMQMIGNIGGRARSENFDKDISLVIISDDIMNRFRNGDKDAFVVDLESRINMSNTPYRKLTFTTEALFLKYLKTRATTKLRINRQDFKDKTNTEEDNGVIKNAIERDELMICLLKKYKEQELLF